MATGTFSARYMRLWYRDRMLKVTLAVLVATLSFSFALVRRVEDDFVPNLGVTVAGVLVVTSAASIQVVRRLRAMLDELSDTVLPGHRAAVLDEISRLDATVAETWSRSVDLDRARIPDHQGIGGRSIHQTRSG